MFLVYFVNVMFGLQPVRELRGEHGLADIFLNMQLDTELSNPKAQDGL